MLSNVFLADPSARPSAASAARWRRYPHRHWVVLQSKLPSGARRTPDQVDEVIFGNVLGAGLGQNVARQAAIGAGLPPGVGATTVNKVCGSGLKAVMLAAQAIQCGDAQLIVAGGTENMSAAPYLLAKARTGYRMGNGELIDSMIHDGLWDVYNNVHMGTCGDQLRRQVRLLPPAAGRFCRGQLPAGHRRPRQNGTFAEEIVPVEVPGRKGTVTVAEDEEPGRFNEEKLRQLSPGLRQGRHRHGRQRLQRQRRRAAAVVVVAEKRPRNWGSSPRPESSATPPFSREPEWFTLAPIGAIAKAGADSWG